MGCSCTVRADLTCSKAAPDTYFRAYASPRIRTSLAPWTIGIDNWPDPQTLTFAPDCKGVESTSTLGGCGGGLRLAPNGDSRCGLRRHGASRRADARLWCSLRCAWHAWLRRVGRSTRAAECHFRELCASAVAQAPTPPCGHPGALLGGCGDWGTAREMRVWALRCNGDLARWVCLERAVHWQEAGSLFCLALALFAVFPKGSGPTGESKPCTPLTC